MADELAITIVLPANPKSRKSEAAASGGNGAAKGRCSTFSIHIRDDLYLPHSCLASLGHAQAAVMLGQLPQLGHACSGGACALPAGHMQRQRGAPMQLLLLHVISR